MIIESLDISFYKKELDNLYKDYLKPIINNQGKNPNEVPSLATNFDFWDSDSNKPTDTLCRCSYEVYEEISSKDKPPSSDIIKYNYKNIPDNWVKKNLVGKLSIKTRRGITSVNKIGCYKKYKNYNGYMGWHTNADKPGPRWYFVYNTDNNSSFTRFIDPESKEMITHNEPKGWSLNHFIIRDTTNPLWHCVYTDTKRFSLGLIPRSCLSH